MSLEHDPVATLLLPNERHHRLFDGSTIRKAFQDHAVALRSPWATVVAVADGVSVADRRERFSATQCGAVLAAEIGACAALRAADTGIGAAGLGACVAAELRQVLGPVATYLGDRRHNSLTSTLVLGVRTATWAAVWCAGDGYYGALGRDTDLEFARISRGEAPWLDPPVRRLDGGAVHIGDGHWTAAGGRHLATLGRAHVMPEAAIADDLLPLVLLVEGPTLGLWVATDGLSDEWELASALARRCTLQTHRMAARCRRPADCDDLGVAVCGDLGWALVPTEVG